MLIPMAFFTLCVLLPPYIHAHRPFPSTGALTPTHTYNPTNREATNGQARWLYRSPNNNTGHRKTDCESGFQSELDKVFDLCNLVNRSKNKKQKKNYIYSIVLWFLWKCNLRNKKKLRCVLFFSLKMYREYPFNFNLLWKAPPLLILSFII